MPTTPRPLAKEFLDWQVALRLHTMQERKGAPHMGVVPTVTVKRPGTELGVTSHNIVCGLLPREDLLEAKTAEFKALYDETSGEGAKALYDRGIEYLLDYYQQADIFDPDSITTMLAEDTALVTALRAEPACALVFNVFDTAAPQQLGAPRCHHIDAVAEVLTEGPVFDNVWWHNTLFHGKASEAAVIRFRHLRSWDTCFGGLEPLVG